MRETRTVMFDKAHQRHISLRRRLPFLLGGGSFHRFFAPGLALWVILVSLIVQQGCAAKRTQPVALAPDDMCSYCKMAISEKRYAAELIDQDGQAFKFDDIGCLVNFVRNNTNKIKIAGQFVIDFNDREWLKADDAYYVHSAELNTPMNGQIIAFKNETAAREAADKYRGKILRFQDLFRL